MNYLEYEYKTKTGNNIYNRAYEYTGDTFVHDYKYVRWLESQISKRDSWIKKFCIWFGGN